MHDPKLLFTDLDHRAEHVQRIKEIKMLTP